MANDISEGKQFEEKVYISFIMIIYTTKSADS